MNSKLIIGIIGCGYIADYYVQNIKNSSILKIKSCFDVDKKRLDKFTKFHYLEKAKKIEDILLDPSINLILNLTPPENHFDINYKALENNKNVFCEKPLSLKFEESTILFQLSMKKKLNLWTAPSIIFNNFSRNLRKKIIPKIDKNKIIGYGFFETPNLSKLKTEKWISPSGAKWPIINEIKNGPIIEHSGYLITLLCSFLGPVKKITSIPKKIFNKSEFKNLNINSERVGLNHTVADLYFHSGSIITLFISENTKSRRSIELFDKNISLCISDIRDDYSPLLYSDSRYQSFINFRSNRIYQIARGFSDFLPTIFALPLLSNNPFIFDKRIKIKKRKVFDFLKNQKPANFHYGLEAQKLFIDLFEYEECLNLFYLHCNEITLAINKNNLNKNINTKFDLTKLLEFLKVYDEYFK
tara:strand:+ start:9665 stop:10906 length:1242 start_codon:yes stop_codon:yes gene_type:complete